MTPNVWGLVLLILVSIGIAVAILLFERPRARRIEEDLREHVDRALEEDG